jgi:long-chain fatty acid transport protein
VIQFDMEMRMGIFRFFALTLLLSMLLVPNIFGNGFAYEGIGVKATGMGGAFRAVADDWSAAYYNPAGYARINDNILSANLASFHNRYWIKPNVLWGDEYESGFYNGLDVPNNHAILNVPQVGAVARFPIWNEMVLGFSIIQLYDQNQKWRLYSNIPTYSAASTPGTQFYNNLDVVSFQFTAARQFLDEKLAVGLGFGILRGDLKYSNLVLRQNGMPAPLSDRPYDKIPEWYEVDGNGWGFGYRAGLIYKVTDKLDAALTYTGKSSIKIKGKTSINFYFGDNFFNSSYSAISQEYLYVSGEVVDLKADFETTLDLPSSIGGGLAYRVSDKLTLAADAEFVMWSSFKGFDFTFSNFYGLKDSSFHYTNDTLLTANLSVPIQWDDAARFMFGANFKPYKFVETRVGFTFDQSPITNATLIPQFIDLGDKYIYSFGLGFEISQWHLDLSTSYTKQPDLKVSTMSDVDGDGLMDNLMGDYRASNYQTVLGVSYRF